MKDLYAILGVPETADADTIKKAYRKLAKQNHPDATGGDKKKTERFKDVGDAYEVLSDVKKRHEYDRLRQAPVGADGMPQGFDADTFSQIFGDYGMGVGPVSPDRLTAAFAGAIHRAGGSGSASVSRSPAGVYTPEYWRFRIEAADTIAQGVLDRAGKSGRVA